MEKDQNINSENLNEEIKEAETEEQILEIEKMLDKMEDDEDVQNIFTNMA